MLQNPDEFSSRVQAMLTCVDVESSPGNNINISSLGGEHLCFLGYGACDVVDEGASFIPLFPTYLLQSIFWFSSIFL